METLIIILLVLGSLIFLYFSFKKSLKSDGCSGCSCSESEHRTCGKEFNFPPKDDE